MPRGLVRYEQAGGFHFLTFSCYRRRPLLADRSGYKIFEQEQELERVRRRHNFCVVGYVVMPEHVHLLVDEPRDVLLSVAVHILKQQVSRRFKKAGELRFWQRRYFDFNVRSHAKTVEKLRYMHRNPVRRGLVKKPEDWAWSSFRHYLTGDMGAVEIESDWTAWRREHLEAAVTPTLPKTGEG